MKDLRVLIIGAYGVDNWGDEAILDRIINDIRINLPGTHIRALSGDPDRTRELHDIEAAHFFPIAKGLFRPIRIQKTLSFLRWADIVILGGGGLFQDYDRRAVLLWSVQCLITSFFNKPLFIWGISLGPLHGRFGQWLTARALGRADYITVRDQYSYRLLTDFGIDPQNTSITGDPGILFDHLEKSCVKKKVIFALRPSRFLGKNFPLVISQFVGFLVENGYEVEFMAMQSRGENSDPRFAMQIAQNFPVFIPDTLDDTIKRISEAKIVVGMRLHSVIFASTQKVPFIALSYSPKVIAFCNEIGAGSFMVPAEKATAISLQRIFKKLIKSPPRLKTKAMQKRARGTINHFKKLLKKLKLD